MSLKHKLYVLGFLALFLIAPLAYQIDRIAMSLPRMDGEQALPGLSQHVNVEFASLGTPTVTAQTRNDAYRTLGYLHARDRLFQMDLLRRRSAGRLAEIMGHKVLEHDIRQRNYGFTDVANNIVFHLPESQRPTPLA